MPLKDPPIERFWQKVQLICRAFKNPKWFCLLPLILFFPSLFIGRIGDDHYHYWKLHFEHKDESPFVIALNFFTFFEPPNDMGQNLGILPWWLELDAKAAFFRPLSAMTHWVDSVLWADVFLLHHLHSLFWACACVVVAHRVFTRVMGKGWPVILCVLLFAVQDAHTFVNGWLANRNANIAFVFGMLAFAAHVRSRRENRWLTVPVLLLALSLLSAEAGFCAFAFIGSWALFHERDIKAIVWSVSPYVVLTVLWRIVYVKSGYGATGITLYTDPGAEPVAFISNIVQNITLLLANQWYKIPAEGTLLLSKTHRPLAFFFALPLVVGLMVVFTKTIRANRQMQFWSLAMVGALVPVAAAVPMERLLLFSGLAFVGLLVGLLQHHEGTLAKWFLVLHLPLAVVLCPLKSVALKTMDLAFTMGYESLPDDTKADEIFVYVNGLEFGAVYSAMMPKLHEEVGPKRIMLLSSAVEVTLTRTGENQLELHVPEGWFENATFVFDPASPLPVGKRMTTLDFTADVLEVTGDGQPSRVLFELSQPLDDPNYRWMYWKGTHYEEFQMDYEIGKTVLFPDPILEILNGG